MTVANGIFQSCANNVWHLVYNS